ncbi:MAG: helix-turn-helix domain-containing protein, partial [Bacteroidota bacterium]
NIQHFSIDKETFTNIDFASHCGFKTIRKIVKKPNGDLWFSAWEGGIGYISNDTIPVANCYNVFPQNQNCFTIFSCSKTEILAGTFNNGLQLLNIQNNTLQQVKHKNINHTLSFRSISSDRFQNTWFGTSKGIIRKGQFPYQFPDNCYAPGEQMADKYRSRDREKLPPELVKRFFGDNPEDLSCFANYKDSVYWIGTWTNGLIKYHKKTNQTKRYVPGQNTNLSLGFINDIFIDHEQSVWIATHGGLNEYDPITDDFIQYHVSPGTKTENILKILPGEQEDYLWLSSGKGIIRFNKKDKEFLVFDHHHNIPKLEFVPGSGEVEKDNKLVFGAESGVFSFYPDSIKYDSLPPLLSIRKIFVNGKPVAYKNNRVLQLSKNENNINIWMQTSNLTLPERVRYRYKMSRVCDTWQDNGYNHEVSFTNLAPGDYTYQFNACNPDLVWANSPLKLDIVIKDNRQRTIFILLIILFLSAAAVAVIIIRKKKIAVKKIKYSGTKISEDILQEYFQQLECYMQNQKPFKQKALHLDDVAKKLNIHPNYLSQAVNQLSGNNFFDYVNRYRVEESKKLLKDPAFENHNLMGIGFEAGFNSKSSFYAVFKKYTGMTPAQYRKKHLKK